MDFSKNFERSTMILLEYGRPWKCKLCSRYILVEARLPLHAAICKPAVPENLVPENAMEDPDRPTANKESPEPNEEKVQLESQLNGNMQQQLDN